MFLHFLPVGDQVFFQRWYRTYISRPQSTPIVTSNLAIHTSQLVVMYLYNASQLIRLKVNVADQGLENNVATNVSVNVNEDLAGRLGFRFTLPGSRAMGWCRSLLDTTGKRYYVCTALPLPISI